MNEVDEGQVLRRHINFRRMAYVADLKSTKRHAHFREIMKRKVRLNI